MMFQLGIVDVVEVRRVNGKLRWCVKFSDGTRKFQEKE